MERIDTHLLVNKGYLKGMEETALRRVRGDRVQKTSFAVYLFGLFAFSYHVYVLPIKRKILKEKR